MTNGNSNVPNWYVNMTSEFNRLAEALGLDENAADSLRSFVVEKAREQFKSGNKSGLRWACTDEGRKHLGFAPNAA
ncbi:MAG: hypothetical protein ACD_76C00121G0002 [uncultured bacterium]|nr:MAG: hypothetical protein ACD_76C00121G0002 [uncultured bacterium]HBD04959.1 hypothetical protein [Candidatus Uhrbacteria bacterium]